MERVWVMGEVAVSMAEIDFEDPAFLGAPDLRERGVRLEVREATTLVDGSIYVSSSVRLAPAFCRIDLLESAPHAADRMHWHPVMADGEPGDRVFDTDMPPDPVGWLRRFLDDPAAALRRAGSDVDDDRAAALPHLQRCADEVAVATDEALARTRAPWPAQVERAATGLAVTS